MAQRVVLVITSAVPAPLLNQNPLAELQTHPMSTMFLFPLFIAHAMRKFIIRAITSQQQAITPLNALHALPRLQQLQPLPSTLRYLDTLKTPATRWAKRADILSTFASSIAISVLHD